MPSGCFSPILAGFSPLESGFVDLMADDRGDIEL